MGAKGSEVGCHSPAYPFFDRTHRRPIAPPVHLGQGNMVVQGGEEEGGVRKGEILTSDKFPECSMVP